MKKIEISAGILGFFFVGSGQYIGKKAGMENSRSTCSGKK